MTPTDIQMIANTTLKIKTDAAENTCHDVHVNFFPANDASVHFLSQNIYWRGALEKELHYFGEQHNSSAAVLR
jgi:hypothetical protein